MSPHACIRRIDSRSRICLPDFSGPGFGGCERKRERVHVGDNRPFSTPLSVLLACSWHTAGHPTKEVPAPPLCTLLLHHPLAYRMPDTHGKEIRRRRRRVKTEKKTLALMGNRKEEVMMRPSAPQILRGLCRGGSVSDAQVFLSSHTNLHPAPLLSGPAGTVSMLTVHVISSYSH